MTNSDVGLIERALRTAGAPLDTGQIQTTTGRAMGSIEKSGLA
jgi:hypothetical protein